MIIKPLPSWELIYAPPGDRMFESMIFRTSRLVRYVCSTRSIEIIEIYITKTFQVPKMEESSPI